MTVSLSFSLLLSSLSRFSRLRTGDRSNVHFGPGYLTYARRNGRSAQNKCKFPWQPSPARPKRVQDPPCFSKRSVSRVYRPPIQSIIRIFLLHEKMNALARHLGTYIHIAIRATWIRPGISWIPAAISQRAPVRLPRRSSRREVSICHINKVNPSPNRKPFPPARTRVVRRKSSLAGGGRRVAATLTEEKLTRAVDSGRKGGGERKDRIDETSNWVPP